MRMKKPVLILSLILSLPLASCKRALVHADSVPLVPVRTGQATIQDVPLEIRAVGNVEAIESVEVRPRISGQILAVTFTEGQNVTTGQLLFRIDRDVVTRQQAQQQAELDRDLAMEQQAREVTIRDEALDRQRKSEASVAVKLGELGVMSGQSVNQAVTTSASASAGVHADEAAIEAASGAVEADRARLAQTALQLNFADVVAPISGRAGAAMAKIGNVVRENETTLVSVLQMSPIHVTFGVPEQTLAEIQRLNAQAPLEVQAGSDYGTAQTGRLEFIDNTVDAATGTVRLKASFANVDGSLWPGEFVHVRLRLKMEHSRLVVPESAIQQGVDGRYAWKVEHGAATTVPIAVERSFRPEGAESRLAVITNGLRGGDVVVTDGQLRLTPGSRVEMLGGSGEPKGGPGE